MRVLAIIPARSCSKGVKDKNIRQCGDLPLIAHTIKAALNSGIFDEVMVSTDSKNYAKIAREFGASVPFLRSKIASSDTAKSIDCVLEVLQNYKNLGREFDILVLLQPTSPLRNADDIKAAFDVFLRQQKSLASVCEGDNLLLLRTLNNQILEKISQENSTKRRQDAKKYYKINGAIYINYISEINENTSFNDNEIYYLMPKERSVDIDSEIDFEIADFLLKRIKK